MLTLTKHSGCLVWNWTSSHFVKGWSGEPRSMVTAYRIPLSTENCMYYNSNTVILIFTIGHFPDMPYYIYIYEVPLQKSLLLSLMT